MASRTCRPGRGRDFDRVRAEQAARAIIAQGRQAARNAPEGRVIFPVDHTPMEEEPMNRYIHPILRPSPTPNQTCGGDVQDYLGRILENMACQNQLLIDILGAINSLTAATLSAHGVR